ncbi:hypothetical protein KPH14_002170 [Odynerus spinipes]|uniref:SANTA domain-containing protein n=1 Tax=Odynerus spinipes TaxID=1348599 RepID=A0AAD9RM74_9HYME|nr:hypothetical protein KPH14_002170 [Odynerus spinipes]
MEMKFEKFKRDERCKKLERSLKLALLRRKGKVINGGQGTPVSIYTSLSSINTDTQDLSYTTSFMQTFQMENEVVSSRNNLQNIKAQKIDRYTLPEPIDQSTSIKRSEIIQNLFDGPIASSLRHVNKSPGVSKVDKSEHNGDILKNCDHSTPIEKNSYLPSMNRKSSRESVNCFKLLNEHAKNKDNDNNDNCSTPQLAIDNVAKGQSKTFFNWRVMLNGDGQLLVKGTLENGKVVRSKPIVKRITATSVQSVFKHIYHLEGNIVDNRGELPEYIRGKFYSGFPDDWENVYQVWLLYVSQGSKESFHWPTKITDSDDDINSEVTDLTILCTQEDKNQHCKSNAISKVQIPNVPSGQISSSGLGSNHWKRHTLEAKADNASNFDIHVPDLRNLPISSTTKKADDRNIWNKENQCQAENVNVHKSSVLRKENTMKDIIQEDKINIIVSNLLHKDCPKEYILKIIQMFDCLHDVFSYKIDTDQKDCESEIQNDGKKSRLSSQLVQGNQVEVNSKEFFTHERRRSPAVSPVTKHIKHNVYNEGVRDVSDRILQEQPEGLRRVQEKISDTLVRRSEMKDGDEFESETYAGVPKVISDKILEHARVNSLKRNKHKQGRGTTDVDPMSRSGLRSKKRLKKDRMQNHHSSSSDVDIEKDKEYFPREDERKEEGRKMKTQRPMLYNMENPGTARYDSSVSITEDEELRREEKLDRARVSGRRERDNPKYNRIRDVSSTDDEMESSQLKREKHLNAREVIKHSAKKPKIVNNNNDADDADRVTDTLNKITVNESCIVKRDIFKNRYTMSASKDRHNVESTFASCFSNKRERDRDEINKFENRPRSGRISRGYEFRMESDKDRENVKSAASEELSPDNDDNPVDLPKSKSTDRREAMQVNNADNKTSGRMRDSSMNESQGIRKSKLLSAWIPRVVYDSKSTSELGLVFEGKLLNEAGHVVHRKFVTECIRKRLSSTVIETTNRELYQLVGDLHDPKHVIPKEILKHCRNGCPSDINEFCKLWRSLQEAHSSEVALNQEEVTRTDVMDLSISSRGRKRFPPLSYWTGERVALKDDKVIYTAGNCKNSSACLTNDNTNDRSNFQEKNDLNKHSRNVEATKTNTDNERTAFVSKHNRISTEQARVEEKECHRVKIPSEPLRHENSSNGLRKGGSTESPIAEQRVDKYTHNDVQWCDTKLRKLYEACRDDDAALQSSERKRRYNRRQRSPIKKQNMMYTYHKSIQHADDVLSDYEISQLEM